MQVQSLTEEQLENFLLQGRGISGHGLTSHAGSMDNVHMAASRADSPTRSSVRNGAAEINETLHSAEILYKQLSSERDLSSKIADQ